MGDRRTSGPSAGARGNIPDMNDVVGTELLKKAVEHSDCGEGVIERAVRGGRRGVKMTRERRQFE